MNIVIIDERGESISTTELNSLINDKLTITIGKDGGLAIVGDKSTIDWSKGLRYPLYDYPQYGYPVVVDCVSDAR